MAFLGMSLAVLAKTKGSARSFQASITPPDRIAPIAAARWNPDRPPRALASVAAVLAVAISLLGAGQASAAAAVFQYDTAAYTYDNPLQLSRTDPVATAHARGSPAGLVAASWGTCAAVARDVVATNTARVWSSADSHVASAANALEAAMPGRVVAVNSQRTMANGLTREVDIDLGSLIVQVKGGNARGLTGQVLRTQASTGTPTVGYAPGISDAAWRNAAQQGIPILRTPDELLAYVREFG